MTDSAKPEQCRDCRRPIVSEDNAEGGTIASHCFAHRKGDWLGDRLCKDNTIARLRAELASAQTMTEHYEFAASYTPVWPWAGGAQGEQGSPGKSRVVRTPWMIDCEFDEKGAGVPIQLISIALVSDDGREYYAADAIFHPGLDSHIEDESLRRNYRQFCNPWVKANVLPYLPADDSPEWKSREQIKADILALVTANHERPEFWGYYADYDWVLFCQLFGRMVDLPSGFPFFCRDLMQLMEEYRVSKRDMPEDPPGFIEHHALHDARKQMEWLKFVNRFYRRQI